MSERSSTRIERRLLAVLSVAVLLAACQGEPGSGGGPGTGKATGGGGGAQHELTLGVAASMRGVTPALTEGFRRAHGGAPIAATYGATGDLAKQVRADAPIDAVLFASAKAVDELATDGLVAPATRQVVATNRLVLIGPKGAKPLTFATIDQAPAGERIAIGEPGAVPAGQYARDALTALGRWDALQDRLVFGGDVAAVLAYARHGEVAAAVVYATDVRGIDDVVVLDEAAGPWAPKPQVVVGLVERSSVRPRAEAFLAFVASPAGQAILREHGFGPP